VESELARETERVGLWDRVRDIQDEIASYPRTGLKTDKAFFDWLSGEEDE
jgi:antitoxin VapB